MTDPQVCTACVPCDHRDHLEVGTRTAHAPTIGGHGLPGIAVRASEIGHCGRHTVVHQRVRPVSCPHATRRRDQKTTFRTCFCGRPWSPNAARTLCTSKGLRLATKLNPSLLANRTPSASNKPLPTDGLFPAHTLDLSLSAVQRCRPGWAGPRRHSPSRARRSWARCT